MHEIQYFNTGKQYSETRDIKKAEKYLKIEKNVWKSRNQSIENFKTPDCKLNVAEVIIGSRKIGEIISFHHYNWIF